MKNFRDPMLVDSVFFLQLLESVSHSPHLVNWAIVIEPHECVTKENRMLNASYVISLCRKLGAIIFISPEDILEGNAKMILTLIASLLALDLGRMTKKNTPRSTSSQNTKEKFFK